MNLPKATRTADNSTPISGTAFQRTVGNNTVTYVLTQVTGDQSAVPLSGAASKAIVDSLDKACGTVDNTVGSTKILCLGNGTSNPCAALTSPIAVAQIVTGSQDGIQVGSAAVNNSLYVLQQPWHEDNMLNFETCMFGVFPQAVQAGLSLDLATVQASAPAHSASASLNPPPKKSTVILCALIGVSVLMGAI